MKYRQIDRILSLDPGRQIVAERTLRAEEEFLLDHFPRFPVMPGVMMLESLHQAAVWMIRAGDEFCHPLVLLREARGVKFGEFLSPGETLRITATVAKREDPFVTVKATAEKNGRVTVTARLRFELCGSGDPEDIGTDQAIRKDVQLQFQELFGEPLQTISPSQ